MAYLRSGGDRPGKLMPEKTSRRQFVSHLGQGLGGIALASLLQKDHLLAAARGKEPDGQPSFRPRAKSVIWLFMRGGFSHLESFDPKPMVTKYAGKSIRETPWSDVQNPDRLKKVRVVVVNDANGQQRNVLLPTQVEFRPRGQSGIPVSDWFTNLGNCVDELAIVRSMWTTDDNHGAQVQFHSGRHMLDGRFPTIGAWVHYGLGSLNDNLPQFITVGPRFFDTRDGHYLGPAHDAVPLKIDPADPLPYARPELDLAAAEQRIGFDLVRELNTITQGRFPNDEQLRARTRSYELAFRMQTAIPQVIDFAQESAVTHQLYGLDDPVTAPFGRQLLAARRFVERGVRFIQIMHGDGAAGAWDAHSQLRENHSSLSKQVDRPVAGLIQDLKQRGLLDETIVVFATEFGRTPGTQGNEGRDHHPFGFSIWMAGGGIRGGTIHGATDEIGFHAVESPHYVTDVHATIMKQLGLDARQLEVPGHKRLEIDFGHPMDAILS